MVSVGFQHLMRSGSAFRSRIWIQGEIYSNPCGTGSETLPGRHINQSCYRTSQRKILYLGRGVGGLNQRSLKYLFEKKKVNCCLLTFYRLISINTQNSCIWLGVVTVLLNGRRLAASAEWLQVKEDSADWLKAEAASAEWTEAAPDSAEYIM